MITAVTGTELLLCSRFGPTACTRLSVFYRRFNQFLSTIPFVTSVSENVVDKGGEKNVSNFVVPSIDPRVRIFKPVVLSHERRKVLCKADMLPEPSPLRKHAW